MELDCDMALELQGMNHSRDRSIDIFFYGLYMDDEILKSKGVVSKNKRTGTADGCRLRIGNNATILRHEGSKTEGLVCSLTHNEIIRLYAGSGLVNYVPEAVLVRLYDGSMVSAICYVLLDPPSDDEINDDYYEKLSVCLESFGLSVPGKEEI